MARKILLADDSVTAQNMGRKILADAGYEVVTVNNGSAALKKIGETKPDLIVLDVYMPGYSGLEVCQRLKEAGDTSRIPVLLTVGKLEPFKPDEAKRVHADGFIVKPFEASELLSALSKLEDKVVPRSESSKPGRFARATAAIDEGRYDKSMAVEEDSGWKNRISFPTKKKEKPAEKEIETGEIYNAVNKDLRTVVDHKHEESAPVASAVAPPAEETHVSVAALAPEGLPKDVTPEEIAALAAAAAQISKVTEEKLPEATATELSVTPASQPEASNAPSQEVKAEEIAAAEPAPEAEKTPAATFAEQETPEEKKDEKETTPEVVSTQADAMNAIMGLETQVMAVFSPESGNVPWAIEKAERTEEPMTMAVAAGADSSTSAAPRWTAVAASVAPEEASISLEQEMQKAYADFAAAESGHAAAASEEHATNAAVSESPSVPSIETAETIATEPAAEAATIRATLAPEVAQPPSSIPEAATEAMSAAVKELEAVAAQYVAEQKSPSTDSDADTSITSAALEPPAVVDEPPATPEEEIAPQIEEDVEAQSVTLAKPPAPEVAEAPAVEAPVPEATTSEFATQEIPVEEKKAEPESPAVETIAPDAEPKAEIALQESNSETVCAEPIEAPNVSTARGTDEMAKRESETAAAWASWRKIRETGSTKPSGEETANQSDQPSQEGAAMAVAAGAESKPEEVAALDSDPEIASIVDSVLADMRPKIVEEIARKLGKKK